MKTLAILVVAALLSIASRVDADPMGLVRDGEQIADAGVFDGAKKEGKLLLYSTFEPTAMAKLIAAFQADTGLSVEVIRLTSQPMFDRTVSEFAAHRLPADFVDTTDITLTDQLNTRGVFAAFPVSEFRRLPASLREPGGHWYTIIRSLMVVGENTALVKPEDAPTKWTDLLDPRWNGKIGIGSIDAGGSTFSAYFFLRQKFGIDFWKKLAAQNLRIVPASVRVMNDISRGETSIAINPQESMLGAIANGAPIKIIYPSGGTPAFGISGGMTSTAPHPHAAELWLDWITSKRGGAVLAASGAYGANPDAPTPTAPGLTMPPSSAVYNIRPSDYTRDRDAYTKEWHEIFGTR